MNAIVHNLLNNMIDFTCRIKNVIKAYNKNYYS